MNAFSFEITTTEGGAAAKRWLKKDGKLIIPNSNIGDHIVNDESALTGPIFETYNTNPTAYGNAMTFTFNSKTGEAKMKTQVRVAKNNNIEESILVNIEENVGDMVCSNYLTIENRNFLNSDGKIDLVDCKKISSDLKLSNVLVFYRNMYL